MPEATRITVGKNDEATVVAEQLIDADTDTIIFIIPKGAAFSQSLNNFKLLKREGSVLGKEIIIESEDPIAQEKAVKAGLEIGEAAAAATAATVDEPEEDARAGRLPRGRSLRVRSANNDEEPVRRIARIKKKAPVEAEQVIDADIEEQELRQEKAGEPTRPVKKHGGFWSRGRIIFSAVACVAAVALFYVGLFVLPRADVRIEISKNSWSYNGNIIIDKSIAKIDSEAGKIPGQVFTQKSTAIVKLPATGKQFIERKATGVLTVYNAYSSQPQNIVANTRFITSSGIVFRITKALLIPGAKIENGTIIPSSVTVSVVADKAGTTGNISSTAKLTIPGFAKTPKYNGFYGELKDGATGGFSGTTKVATDNDVKAAKAEGLKQAEQMVRSQIAGQIPAGFKSIDSATRFTATRQAVDIIAGDDGNFSVSTDAQLSVFAFREQDLKDFLMQRLQTDKGVNFKVDSEELAYTNTNTTSMSPVSGKVALPITYTASLSYNVDIASLRAAIAGQPQNALNTIILGTPGIIGGKVNLWPFYVRTVPSNAEKITITLE